MERRVDGRPSPAGENEVTMARWRCLVVVVGGIAVARPVVDGRGWATRGAQGGAPRSQVTPQSMGMHPASTNILSLRGRRCP